MATPRGDTNARKIGGLSFVLLLNGIQIAISAIVAATFLDYVIEGTMNEATKVMIVDAPWQLLTTAAMLFLACIALRITSGAMLFLLAPDVVSSSRIEGYLARILPRLYPLVLGGVTGGPLVRLSFENAFQGGTALGVGDNVYLPWFSNTQLAATGGLSLIAVGIVVALFRSSKHSAGAGIKLAWLRLFQRVLFGPVPWLLLSALAAMTLWTMVPNCTVESACWNRLGTFGRYAGQGFHYLFVDVVVFVVIAYIVIIAGQIASKLFFGFFAIKSDRRFDPRIPDIIFPIVVLIIGLCMAIGLSKSSPNPYWDDIYNLWPATVQWAIAALFLLLTIGIVLYEVKRVWPSPSAHPIVSTSIERTISGLAGLDGLPRRWFACYAFLMITSFLLTLAFFDISNTWLPTSLGPIAIVLAWALSLSTFIFPLAYLARCTRYPFLLTTIAGAIAFSALDLNDNHSIRFVEPKKSVAANGESPDVRGAISRFDEQLDLDTWLASRPDVGDYDHYPIFVIATEGGGIRAAYYTANVLAALQDICPTFAQHILTISGVSGGSVGAAAFSAMSADLATTRRFEPCHLDGAAPNVFRTRLRKFLAADLLSPLLASMLFPDALQRVLPFPVEAFDRARALEFALEHSWSGQCTGCKHNRMSEPMENLFSDPESSANVPHLILNTTRVETGKQSEISTARQFQYTSGAVWEAGGESANSDIRIQDFLQEDQSIALSTAAMVSARFPLLSPAARYGRDSADTSRYVDGGYFENSGTYAINALVQFLLEQKITYADNKDKLVTEARRKAQIIVVLLRSTPLCRSCTSNTIAVDGLGELLSPLRTLLNTRSSRADYSRLSLAATASLTKTICSLSQNEALRARGVTGPISACWSASGYVAGGITRYPLTVIELGFDTVPGVEVPLTWLLSSRARTEIDEAVDDMVRTDVRGMLAPDGSTSASITYPSDRRTATAAKEGRSAVQGLAELVLCALSTRKDAFDYPTWHVCSNL